MVKNSDFREFFFDRTPTILKDPRKALLKKVTLPSVRLWEQPSGERKKLGREGEKGIRRRWWPNLFLEDIGNPIFQPRVFTMTLPFLSISLSLSCRYNLCQVCQTLFFNGSRVHPEMKNCSKKVKSQRPFHVLVMGFASLSFLIWMAIIFKVRSIRSISRSFLLYVWC